MGGGNTCRQDDKNNLNFPAVDTNVVFNKI